MNCLQCGKESLTGMLCVECRPSGLTLRELRTLNSMMRNRARIHAVKTAERIRRDPKATFRIEKED